MNNDNPKMQEALAKFPGTFGLKAFAGTFRVSSSHSYINDDGVVMLYTEIQSTGWESFCKGTVQELEAAIVRKPPQSYAELKAAAEDLLEVAAGYAGDGAILTALERAHAAIAILQEAHVAKLKLLPPVVAANEVKRGAVPKGGIAKMSDIAPWAKQGLPKGHPGKNGGQ